MRIEHHPEGIEMDIDPDRPWWRRVLDFILRRKPQRYYTVVDMEGQILTSPTERRIG